MFETLKAILRNQIFGVELEPGAVDLTAFSLALAVCDSLQPNVIWSELRFDRLRGSKPSGGRLLRRVFAERRGAAGAARPVRLRSRQPAL